MRKKILVLDDGPQIREALRKALRDMEKQLEMTREPVQGSPEEIP
ncbi:MAG TPA: hypothetical protein P5186_06650 [Candidatus Paceibacterota bacterium]|nr:hypothetical protein [Verrucomicrobiota bacterium]HRY47709.1 hypothetical protein [Candidatus Paceibacterota bacterium]